MSKLYWNNICLITRIEESFIKNIITKENLNIDDEYFGLGRKETMLSRIVRDVKNGRIDGDVIVSTDTDIIHNRQLLPRNPSFQQIDNYFDIDKELQFLSSPCKRFIPFIIIPLVVVYNKNNITKDELPKTYEEFIAPKYYKRFSIGGTHNSAGKSIFKSLWCRYGEEFTRIFIKNSITYTMPAAAYNSVKTGKADFAIVPTIFSDRSNKDLGKYIPDEGIIPIPSYIAIKNGIDISMYKNNILTDELQKQLFKSANIITTFKGNSYKKDDFFTASWDFLYKLDHNYFYKTIISSVS